MSVNWIRLYELSNENNKITGSRFEKLVLDYLNKYYKEYQVKIQMGVLYFLVGIKDLGKPTY